MRPDGSQMRRLLKRRDGRRWLQWDTSGEVEFGECDQEIRALACSECTKLRHAGIHIWFCSLTPDCQFGDT